MTKQSHINTSICMWQPQEHEIKIHLQPESARNEGIFPYENFWLFDLGSDLSMGVGRYADDLASDAAAMRKLAAAAAELAGLLEDRIASVQAQEASAVLDEAPF